MAWKKVHIGAATLLVDEATGLLGVLSQANILEADVEAIVDGIAGAAPKTQKDLHDSLAALLAELKTGNIKAGLDGIYGDLGTMLTRLNGLAAAHNGGSAVSISAASTQVAAANIDRRSITITNLSLTAALTLNLGGTAVSGAGIVLAPALDATHPGGTVTIDDYTGAINGIMSAADATPNNVAVAEV